MKYLVPLILALVVIAQVTEAKRNWKGKNKGKGKNKAGKLALKSTIFQS